MNLSDSDFSDPEPTIKPPSLSYMKKTLSTAKPEVSSVHFRILETDENKRYRDIRTGAKKMRCSKTIVDGNPVVLVKGFQVKNTVMKLENQLDLKSLAVSRRCDFKDLSKRSKRQKGAEVVKVFDAICQVRLFTW